MRLVRRVRTNQGDTLIEVMFAFAIFALVAVGSLTIMNQGIATAQRSLEITLVRAQMDAQAEAIRYIHQAYVAAYQKGGPTPTGTAAEWLAMTSKTTGKGADSASQFGQTNDTLCPETVPGERPFILNARTATVWDSVPQSSPLAGASLPPFAQIIYNDDSSINQAYGIWVEAIPSSSNTNGTGFVDFHIRSCWSGAGSSAPVTLGTIVRLYEPR
ncbi:MAG TPA: prepilin-type N-terminal cleavage/methylation domain-containing protein [Candidatus Saccharimonadales bacterium]|nr:prepilin-type N-terminal cleavage/methylation domain-containing protein [Candidatus Saccharimonadales bacterium]